MATMNKGIWVCNKYVITYEQTKVGLTSIYIKRNLCRDDVSTILLDL